mmetsp:Transcript_149047/g.477340  ORF Transcript_149047/g.477340 Transcript_149047/m.477340 type:complete len:207 (-) Transcript_149047:5-625(-)
MHLGRASKSSRRRRTARNHRRICGTVCAFPSARPHLSWRCLRQLSASRVRSLRRCTGSALQLHPSSSSCRRLASPLLSGQLPALPPVPRPIRLSRLLLLSLRASPLLVGTRPRESDFLSLSSLTACCCCFVLPRILYRREQLTLGRLPATPRPRGHGLLAPSPQNTRCCGLPVIQLQRRRLPRFLLAATPTLPSGVWQRQRTDCPM